MSLAPTDGQPTTPTNKTKHNNRGPTNSDDGQTQSAEHEHSSGQPGEKTGKKRTNRKRGGMKHRQREEDRNLAAMRAPDHGMTDRNASAVDAPEEDHLTTDDAKPKDRAKSPTTPPYPNDGVWRPSKGFFNNAPQKTPYSQGGSPFQTVSRIINGHFQIAVEVDPAYLRHTGMTVDQALAEPMARFNDLTGIPSSAPGPKGFERTMKKWMAEQQARRGSDADSFKHIAAELYADQFYKLQRQGQRGDTENEVKAFLAQAAQAGGFSEDFEGIDVLIMEKVKVSGK